MAGEWIEARLYWGEDLLAVTHTVARKDVRLEEVRVEDLGLPALPDAGDVSVHLALVPKVDARIPRSSRERGVAGAFVIALALHMLFMAVSFHGRAAPGDEEESARAALATYAAAIDAREHERIETRPAPPPDKGGEPAGG